MKRKPRSLVARSSAWLLPIAMLLVALCLCLACARPAGAPSAALHVDGSGGQDTLP
jgi:hypothetical protein